MSRNCFIVLRVALYLVYFLDSSVNCHKVLDCDFPHSNTYFLEKRSLVPKWGQPPTPIQFSTENRLKEFLDEATKIYNEVLTSNQYNTVDSFFKFYQDSQQVIAEDSTKLFEFYVNYEYSFRPRENGLGLGIEILNQISINLKDKYPEVANKGYLASSPVGLNQGELQTYAETMDNLKVHSRKLINAVATLKIEVEGKTVFVMFSAAYYFDKPIILVQGHPEDPLNSKIVFARGIKYIAEFVPSHEDYVSIAIYLRSNEDQVYAYDIVYLRESYCSFMDTTDKRVLVYPFKSLLKRSQGEVVSGFQANFMTMMSEGSRYLSTFLATQSNANTKTVDENVLLPVNSTGDLEKELSSGAKDRLNEIADSLGTTRKEFLGKVATLNQIISDTNFLTTMVDLNNLLRQYDGEQLEFIVQAAKTQNNSPNEGGA